VGVSNGPQFANTAFRWANATGMVALGPPLNGSTESFADAVTAHGAAIVGRSGGLMIWRGSTGMQPLFTYLDSLGTDMSGWDINNGSGPMAISADGSAIAGSARYQGQLRAFLARIPCLDSPLVWTNPV